MGTGRIAGVSDAGPLIHLAEIDCLSLLSIFENLHIPDAVWLEIDRYGHTLQMISPGLRNIHKHTLPQTEITVFVKNNHLEELHFGERECLYLCQQMGITVLLTDDLAVRESAKRLHLTPVGSLGIVVRAYRTGHIALSEAEQRILDLYKVSSLFVTRTIVELAIEQLHKSA